MTTYTNRLNALSKEATYVLSETGIGDGTVEWAFGEGGGEDSQFAKWCAFTFYTKRDDANRITARLYNEDAKRQSRAKFLPVEL